MSQTVHESTSATLALALHSAQERADEYAREVAALKATLVECEGHALTASVVLTRCYNVPDHIHVERATGILARLVACSRIATGRGERA